MTISLQKGQKISLEKDGGSVSKVCVGVNWGAIEGRGFFGGKKMIAVDLDASVGVFDASRELIDIVYFGNLRGQGINHSGDDLTGDMDGDDGLDNEVIVVDLDRVSTSADQIVFVLNSFQGQDFKDIPFASIRLYEGTPERVDNILATYDVANDPQFRGAVSMVMGKMYKNNGKWKFAAFGETTPDRNLEGTLQTVHRSYL